MKNKQKEYDKRWVEKNKEHRRKLSYRSTARTFINNYADEDDLKELEKLIKNKLKNC